MSDSYAQLFQQLYQKKYVTSEQPKNYIERVKQIQRKIKQSSSSKKMSRKINDYQYTERLYSSGQLNDQNHPKILRFALNQPKKFNKNNIFYALEQSQEITWPKTQQTRRQVATAVTNRRRSLSHRIKNSINSIPTQLYHSKKISFVRPQNYYNRSFEKNNTSSPFKIANNREKVKEKVPSCNVFIGGRNLQEQAQVYRREFRKMDQQIQLYHKELKEKQIKDSRELQSIGNRRKILRYDKIPKSSRNQKRKGDKPKIIEKGKQVQKKKLNNGNKQKEQNIQLLPWALVPQHQFY